MLLDGIDPQSGRTQLFNACEYFAQNSLRTSPDAKSTNYDRQNGKQSSKDRSKEGQEKTIRLTNRR